MTGVSTANAWKKTYCKETKLEEFHFKLIHRVIVATKKFYRYGVKADDECLYCGEKDSIDHTFINCQFVKTFVNYLIDSFSDTS